MHETRRRQTSDACRRVQVRSNGKASGKKAVVPNSEIVSFAVSCQIESRENQRRVANRSLGQGSYDKGKVRNFSLIYFFFCSVPLLADGAFSNAAYSAPISCSDVSSTTSNAIRAPDRRNGKSVSSGTARTTNGKPTRGQS